MRSFRFFLLGIIKERVIRAIVVNLEGILVQKEVYLCWV